MDRRAENVFGENLYICGLRMKKLVFLMMFFLLTGTNSAVISFAYSGCKDFINMALNNSEEHSEEESKSFLEEDSDEITIGHRWMSKEQSHDSFLHFVYQDVLFHELGLEVVVPPPKA